jgi:hypothetical protein
MARPGRGTKLVGLPSSPAKAVNFLKRLRRRQPRKRAFTATPHTTYAESLRLVNGQLSAEQFRAVIRRNVDLIHADRDDLARDAPVEPNPDEGLPAD